MTSRTEIRGCCLTKQQAPPSSGCNEGAVPEEGSPTVISVNTSWEVFIGLLHSMDSEDDAVKETAEKKYEEMVVDDKLIHLYTLFTRIDEYKQHRYFCIENLLRNFLNDKCTIIRVWMMPKIAKFRTDLLEMFQSSDDYDHKCHIAELIAVLFDLIGWKDLSSFLSACVASKETRKEEHALVLYSYISGSLVSRKLDNFPLKCIAPLVKKGVHHEEEGMRRAAMALLGALISDKIDVGLISVPLSVLIEIGSKKCDVSGGCSKDHAEAIDCIYSLVLEKKVRKSDAVKLVDFFCKTILGGFGDCRTRRHRIVGTQGITILSETFTSKIKHHQIPNILKGSLITVGDGLIDEKEWKAVDPVEEKEETMVMAYGTWYFLNIVRYCKGRIHPHLANAINDLVKDEGDWRKRTAGVWALFLLEKEYWRREPSHVVDVIIRCLTDTHYRVRYTACILLVMSMEYFKDIDCNRIEKMLIGLRVPLADLIPRVAAAAIWTLQVFCMKTSRQELLAKQYEHLMPLVVTALKNRITQRSFVEAFTCYFHLAKVVQKDKVILHFEEVMEAVSGGPLIPTKDHPTFVMVANTLCEIVGPEDIERLLNTVVDKLGACGDGLQVLASLIEKYEGFNEIVKGWTTEKIEEGGRRFMSPLIKIVALGCILAVNGAELAREKRQLLVDSMGPSVVDPYVDPMFAPVPRVVYRRPTVVLQRPSFYPEIYSRPFVRPVYRPVYREVVPPMFAEPQPIIVRRPTLAVAAPAVPVVAPGPYASDILIKKKKL